MLDHFVRQESETCGPSQMHTNLTNLANRLRAIPFDILWGGRMKKKEICEGGQRRKCVGGGR